MKMVLTVLSCYEEKERLEKKRRTSCWASLAFLLRLCPSLSMPMVVSAEDKTTSKRTKLPLPTTRKGLEKDYEHPLTLQTPGAWATLLTWSSFAKRALAFLPFLLSDGR
jgi:hypothetical protein